NPRCSKSRCALEVLKDSNEEYSVVDYIKNRPTIEDLKELLIQLGMSPTDLVRRGEAAWKEKYKHLSMDDEALLKMMVEHPQLIDRPIVSNGKIAVIARPADRISELL